MVPGAAVSQLTAVSNVAPGNVGPVFETRAAPDVSTTAERFEVTARPYMQNRILHILSARCIDGQMDYTRSEAKCRY